MNVAQSEILSELVDIYSEQSRYDRAISLQGYLVNIYRRAYSDAHPVVVAAWRRNGELLGLSGEHREAQELYRHAMDLIRVADGSDSLAQLSLLQDLSASVLRHTVADDFTRVEMARAELERAVSITRSNGAATPVQRADAHLQLGDFYQRFGEWGSALVNFRDAWNVLAADPAEHDLLKTYFDQPVLVRGGKMGTAPDIDSDSAVTALTVRYDVNRRGRVENAAVVSDNADDSLARRALDRTRNLVYRPRFENGEPVATRNLIANTPTGD